MGISSPWEEGKISSKECYIQRQVQWYVFDSLGMFYCGYEKSIGSYVQEQNADAYITILQENLVPFIETLPQHLQCDFVFQQDNAKIHTVFKTMDFFKEHSITVMEWPPNSPDMNPIEHLWHCLKTALHR